MLHFLSAADTELATLALSHSQQAKAFLATTRLADGFSERGMTQLLSQVAESNGAWVLRILGGKARFENEISQLKHACEEHGRPLVLLPGDAHPDPELQRLSNVDVATYTQIYHYLVEGGSDNLAAFTDYCAAAWFGFEGQVKPPEKTPAHGFVNPFENKVYATFEKFAQDHLTPGKRPVGILFYRALWQSKQLAAVQALWKAIEANGQSPVPLFCYSLRDEVHNHPDDGVVSLLLNPEGTARVDVLITMLSFAAADLQTEFRATKAEEARFLQTLNVPALQALSSSEELAKWEANVAGLSPVDLAMNVVLPEFDGRIISLPISFKEKSETGAVTYRTHAGLVKRLAAQAGALCRLRNTENKHKKVAVILTNSAANKGRMGGAVGLDTPASLIELLTHLRAEGYDVGDFPSDANELMAELGKRGGYDKDYLTADEMERSQAHLSASKYAAWFGQLPEKNQKAMVAQWGEAPGSVYVHNQRLYLGGLKFGNIFLALQPPRGFGEDLSAAHHSSELVPTHHYFGFYRWLRDEFQADAMIHLGKHGSLEWLPGKAVALGESCYPEALIGHLPVFYPFIINDPGEGMAAKRRKHAVIVDHMIPPMTTAGTYNHLARMERLLGEHARVSQLDPEKIGLVEDEIWQLALEAKLERDLGLKEKPTGHDFEHFLEDVDAYLCELGDMQIRDGLHIFGKPPEGEQLANLVNALMRLDAPPIPSIRKAVCDEWGLDFGALMDASRLNEALKLTGEPAEALGNATTHSDGLRLVEEAGRNLVGAMLAEGAGEAADVASEQGFSATGPIAAALGAARSEVLPLVLACRGELAAISTGLEGGFIPAGPSGAPTRGMTNVLPTGRNFYSVDTRAIPTRFAWRVGQALADQVIRRYQTETGEAMPESVGMVIWGTSNMRTHGDDIAQALALYGVRPKWHPENSRIEGLELIPLAELGRPRVDVTIRISGFFRDAFPNVVKLLDQAAQLAASAEESLDQNFVRKHMLEAQSEYEGEGMSPQEAKEQASFRVFGCKPGTYGAGILQVIENGNWENQEDLARIYVNWGGYAYGATQFGKAAHVPFQDRLSEVSVAVQNQDNREHDIFDSDDYMQFHGGMVAAIRHLRGQKPVAMFGDSADPERPEARELADHACRVFRARVVNPKWLAAAKRHGYKGALEMAATVDYLFGYDATAEIIDDWMYEDLAQNYTLDEEMQAFLKDANPWALKGMTERLLEAASRGMWNEPKPETKAALEEQLLGLEGELEDASDEG